MSDTLERLREEYRLGLDDREEMAAWGFAYGRALLDIAEAAQRSPHPVWPPSKVDMAWMVAYTVWFDSLHEGALAALDSAAGGRIPPPKTEPVEHGATWKKWRNAGGAER